MNDRLKNARNLLEKKNLEAVILTDLSNIRYVSNFAGTVAYCLITGNAGYMIVDKRYYEQAQNQCEEFQIFEWSKLANPPYKVIGKICEYESIKSLGFEKNKISLLTYEDILSNVSGLILHPVESFIEDLRYVKDKNEIELLKTAAGIGDKAFDDILNYIKEGVTEKDILRELNISLLKYGAAGPSFNTIVAGGERSSMEHARPTDSVIKRGNFVLMDFGALYEGYRSDMTRTVIVGEPNEKQAEIYDSVYKSITYVEDRIKSGTKGTEAQKISEEPVRNSKYFEYFSKGLGHGVGLDVHENPFINQNCTHVLEKNCVVTAEPRIHIPGWGGVRIEDMLLITDDGCEVLTKSKKELIAL